MFVSNTLVRFAAALACSLVSMAQNAQELNRQAASALRAGQSEQALKKLEQARKLAPADPAINLNLGLAYVRSGRCAEAEAPLQRAKSAAAAADKARFLLGSCYFQTGRFKPAAAELEPLRAHPEYAENALYILEESYRKSKNGPAAERAFAELLKGYPDSALVHKLLGAAYDSQGRYKEALAEFEQAVKRDPSLPEVKFAIGLIHLKLHDDAAARTALTDEVKLNPCFATALYYLGEIDRRSNDLTSAEGFYRRAIRCAPQSGESHLGLGITLAAEGKDAEALPVFRRAAALAPGKSEAHFQLARALSKAGLAKEAHEELRKAKELAQAQQEKDVADLQRKSAP